ncbi:MAG: hypothetical protein LBQ13_02075 [Endomicrobium sp.]|jgi:translation initiation factor 2B subunit (eIF-2B alpha/beta/delta family)|nr:hypothetical protein [Endomicrobium sp.]
MKISKSKIREDMEKLFNELEHLQKAISQKEIEIDYMRRIIEALNTLKRQYKDTCKEVECDLIEDIKNLISFIYCNFPIRFALDETLLFLSRLWKTIEDNEEKKDKEGLNESDQR